LTLLRSLPGPLGFKLRVTSAPQIAVISMPADYIPSLRKSHSKEMVIPWHKNILDTQSLSDI